MGKTFKDRKVKQLEEQHYTPKVFNDKYRREKISKKDIIDGYDDDCTEAD